MIDVEEYRESWNRFSFDDLIQQWEEEENEIVKSNLEAYIKDTYPRKWREYHTEDFEQDN